MLFLKQPLILPFLYHKSASTCQIDSNNVSNSKSKPDLCNCAKSEIIETTTPPQQPHKHYQPGSLRQLDRVRLRVLGARHAIC